MKNKKYDKSTYEEKSILKLIFSHIIWFLLGVITNILLRYVIK